MNKKRKTFLILIIINLGLVTSVSEAYNSENYTNMSDRETIEKDLIFNNSENYTNMFGGETIENDEDINDETIGAWKDEEDETDIHSEDLKIKQSHGFGYMTILFESLIVILILMLLHYKIKN